MSDYNADWVLKEAHVDARPDAHEGYLGREEIIRFYGTLDLQGIELNHSYWADYDAQSLKRLSDGAGARIATYVVFADLVQTGAGRDQALDQLYALMERTLELGARKMFLLPAVYKPGVALGEQLQWMIGSLTLAARKAEGLGLTIIAENIDYPPSRPLMGRGSQCRQICDAVNSPAFRLIYDVAAPLFVGEDSLATLEEMAPSMAHVHLKNFRRLPPAAEAARYLVSDTGERFTGALLDTGVLQLKPVLARLKQLGYDGWVQVEYQGEDDPRPALQHNLEYLRRLEQEVEKGETAAC